MTDVSSDDTMTDVSSDDTMTDVSSDDTMTDVSSDDTMTVDVSSLLKSISSPLQHQFIHYDPLCSLQTLQFRFDTSPQAG
jgi:hypothetical protein